METGLDIDIVIALGFNLGIEHTAKIAETNQVTRRGTRAPDRLLPPLTPLHPIDALLSSLNFLPYTLRILYLFGLNASSSDRSCFWGTVTQTPTGALPRTPLGDSRPPGPFQEPLTTPWQPPLNEPDILCAARA